MGGLLDTPPEKSRLAPLAFFNNPEVLEAQRELFGRITRSRRTTTLIQNIKERLKDELYAFVEEFEIGLLVPQNILAIPMHIPLGLATTEFIAEVCSAALPRQIPRGVPHGGGGCCHDRAVRAAPVHAPHLQAAGRQGVRVCGHTCGARVWPWH
jgi:hypothetical protein